MADTPSPTVCGCGQGDILWYVNSRHPVMEDGDTTNVSYPRTYQILNPSSISDDMEQTTPSSVLLEASPIARTADEILTSEPSPPPPQQQQQSHPNATTIRSPSDFPPAAIGNTGYIVVGPETFNYAANPDHSIPSSFGSGNAGPTEQRDDGYSDLSVAAGHQLPDLCTFSPASCAATRRQSHDGGVVVGKSDAGPIAFSGGGDPSPSETGTEHSAVPYLSDVVPLTQYARIVGALGRSSTPDELVRRVDASSFAGQPPVVVDRNNGLASGPCYDADIAFGNGAVSFHNNGYVRHTDLFGQTAAVVDS